MTTVLPIIQLTAYVMLTLASLAVGAISALIAYRSNFGWKPLVLVTSHGLRFGGSLDYDAMLSFEVWNRRKYPIALRHIELQFGSIELDRKRIDISAPWEAHEDGLLYQPKTTLGPSSHQAFEASAPMLVQQLDDVDEIIRIKTFYFDPRTSRHKAIRVKYRYSFVQKPRWLSIPIKVWKSK